MLVTRCSLCLSDDDVAGSAALWLVHAVHEYLSEILREPRMSPPPGLGGCSAASVVVASHEHIYIFWDMMSMSVVSSS